MKNLIKNLGILFVVVVSAFIFAGLFGKAYSLFFNLAGGFSGFIAPDFFGNFLDGISRSYIFFLTLLFTMFGGEKKYWVIGVLLIPAVVFEVYFDLSHIYFPIMLGVIGWLLGLAIRKFFPR